MLLGTFSRIIMIEIPIFRDVQMLNFQTWYNLHITSDYTQTQTVYMWIDGKLALQFPVVDAPQFLPQYSLGLGGSNFYDSPSLLPIISSCFKNLTLYTNAGNKIIQK